jgi:hypothetical protein
MLMILGAVASQQAYATTNTADTMVHFLNYCATYLDTIAMYHANCMKLHIHSNASYFSEPQTLSCTGGNFPSIVPSMYQ